MIQNMTDRDALAGSWRRLRRHIEAVRTGEGEDLRDAAVGCLQEIYDLWEMWSTARGITFAQEDQAVEGDDEGETAAALVFARGGRTHRGIEPGELFVYGSGAFGSGPFGGGWAWHEYSDPNARYAKRNAWYRDHVEGHLIVRPLDVAVRWLETQPELTP